MKTTTMHLRYARYVLRHKWFVLAECWKRRLYWRGLMHDLSKLLPSEWFPYARHFYGPRSGNVDVAGSPYMPHEQAAFDLAWLHHQNVNDHHWQWWMLTEDDTGQPKCLPMSPAARLEMLCDWRGAGRAQGYGDNTLPWYEKNKGRMQLHPDTRRWVEEALLIAAAEHPDA